MRKNFIASLVLLLSFFILIGCNPGISSPNNNGEGSQPTIPSTPEIPETEDGDGRFFTITEERFDVEKTIAKALIAIDYDTLLSTGTYTIVDNGDGLSGTVTIPQASSKAVSAVENAFKIVMDITLKESDKTIELDYSATAESFNGALNGVKTLSASAAINGNKVNEIKDSFTPVAIAAADLAEPINMLLREYISDQKKTSFEYKGIRFEILEGSWVFENDKIGAIVFRCPDIDNEMHKVNFTVLGNGIYSMEIDGWAKMTETGLEISDVPAIKSSDAELTDEEALWIGIETYSFGPYSTMSYLDYKGSDIEHTGSEIKTMIEFKGFTEETFFGSPKSITGTITNDNVKKTMDISLDVGGSKRVLQATGGSNNSSIAGWYDTFTIDGKSYSHLRDELYKGSVRVFYTFYNLTNLVRQAGENNRIEPTIIKNGTMYFENVKPDYDLSGFTFNGTISNNGEDLYVLDMRISEENTIDVNVKAECIVHGNSVTWNSVVYNEFGALDSNELEKANLIAGKMMSVSGNSSTES